MTDPQQTLRYPQIQAEEGLDDWRFFLEKLHARFRTASCQSEEQAVLKDIEAKRAALDDLRETQRQLEGFRDTAKVFAAEEAEWAKLNWRLVGAAAR